MVGEWVDTILGDVLTLQRGFDLPKTERKPGRYPVIASTGPVGWHLEAAVKGPGVVIGRSGSLGGGQYIAGDFWPLNTTLWVKDFKGNDCRFCYYLIKSLDLAQFNVGSGVPTLNRNHIHPLPLSVPRDPTEQRAIAHILGTLDDKIELNRRMNETLEGMARALFKSWFVDFDPVRAKAEGHDAGLPKKIASLFPDRLMDSELGKIPEGWRVEPIGEMVKVVGGSTPSTKVPEYWGGEFCWSTPKDLSGIRSPVLLDTTRRITNRGLSTISSGLLPVDTLLLSSRAPVGYLAIVKVPVAVNQGFIAMPPGDRLSSLFLLFWCELNLERIKERAGGTTFQEISKANFRPIPLIVPADEALASFDAKVGPMFESMVSNERESHCLVALRETLLPGLISGELRVPHAEKVVGRAV